ncbi:MAG: Mfa1 family fimbria major subunit [Muribaculaceae bacterium]|nr:Mfa1 family fimbria major subunit [Muribaculaceae bacterium]
MKKTDFLWTLVALPLMASCAHDDVPNSGADPESNMGQDGVYMTVTLNPSGNNGTRSQTNGNDSSDDGVEVGSDVENAVKTALIVITDRNNKYIASSLVPGNDNKGSLEAVPVAGNPLYQTTAKFDKTDIGTYYENAEGEDIDKVNVFVFCNPTSALIEMINQVGDGTYEGEGNWYDGVYTVSSSDGIWNAERGFTMSNVSMAERQFPANMEEWNKYSTAASPFKLSGLNSPGTEGAVDNLTNRGAVSVESMASRFDLRDCSQIYNLGNGIKGEPFTYAVVNDTEGNNIVKCKIYAMALTNMSKTQYYLGRVSNNGLPTGADYALCGAETPDNYVVSTNAQAKYSIIDKNFSDYFDYPFFDTEGLVANKGAGWDWIYCTEVAKGAADNYGDKSYHVWRYVTENTIPGRDKQVNSQSTGVIFKSRMLPTALLNESNDKWEKELYEALTYANNGAGSSILHQNADLDPILYSLSGNTLYVSWPNVRAAALAAAGYNPEKGNDQDLDRKVPLYVLCFGTGGVGTYTNDGVTFTDDLPQDQTSANYLWEIWESARNADPEHTSLVAQNARSEFKAKATSLGFTLYQSSQDPVTNDWGYYCYYYYWNRHNDNLQPGVMGRMEFAVVRNNVYKLTVTKLNTLGHPRIPENDPDDPTPETPDELSEVYITVSVDIVPWVVRINNIEF